MERSTSWTPDRSVLSDCTVAQSEMSSFLEPKPDADTELKQPLVSSNEHLNDTKIEVKEKESSL